MKQTREWSAIRFAGLFVLCAASVTWASSKHDFEVVDSSLVYYGSGKHPKTPAACRADDVWAEIPEYKKIVEEELTDSDPRYHLLLKRATKRFQSALKKLAHREGYDMIAEDGAVKAVGEDKKDIASATNDLIELVSRD